MGELLTFDLPRALSTLARELHLAAMLQAMPTEDADPERLEHLLDEHEEQLKTASAEFSSVSMRLSWLQERVGSLARHNSLTRDFRKKSTRLYVSAMMFTTLEWNASRRSDEFITEEEIDEARGKVESSMRQVLELTKDFATSPPPRNSLRSSIGNHVRRPLHITRSSVTDLWFGSRGRAGNARESGAAGPWFGYRSGDVRDPESSDAEP